MVKNLRKNSKAPLFIDQYSEDWMRHVATMMTGTVDVIEKGSEFEKAKELLEAKYQQYNELFPIKEGESVILCFKPTKAVASDYVLGVKSVIWPLSIFASAERLSSDEKSSVTNEVDEAAAVLDWVDIQLEARTQTVRRTRRDRADEYARKRGPLSLFLLRHLTQNERVRDESVAAANGKAAEMAAHF